MFLRTNKAKLVKKEKRFSLIPRRVRKIFTRNINRICKEERVPKEDIELVIVSALQKAEDVKKEKTSLTWRKVWNIIYYETISQTEILSSQFEPDF